MNYTLVLICGPQDEVKGLKEREFSIEDENTKLKIENINKQSFLAIQEEKSAKVSRERSEAKGGW